MVRIGLSLLVLSVLTSCAKRSPILVGVVFENSWPLGGQPLTASEQSLVKSAALDSLKVAYAGFAVQFAETPTADRVIRVEDTPYGTMGQFRAPGAAGLTYPGSAVSIVRFDVLSFAELSAAGCRDMAKCTKTRAELVEGLGRGVGATAAHELGHQIGVRFVGDSKCDECYDGNRSTSYVHFFGTKHWSSEAAALMKRTLPPASVVR